nr:immunoglobulin light chain junction region [Macaca mulatta]
CQQESNWPPF